MCVFEDIICMSYIATLTAYTHTLPTHTCTHTHTHAHTRMQTHTHTHTLYTYTLHTPHTCTHRTKRMVVDVLRVQSGENLTEVLYTPATPEQEDEHQKLVQRQEQAEHNRHGAMKKSESMYGDKK